MAKKKQLDNESETEEILAKENPVEGEEISEAAFISGGEDLEGIIGVDAVDEVFGEETIPLEEEIVSPEEDGLEEDAYDFSLEDYDN